MVDGQQFKTSIGAVIQVRMNSTRLPGKVLKPLPYPTGAPMLKIIVDSLNQTESVSTVVIATTTDSSDDPIEKFAVQNGIEFFRGDELNVYDRFHQICKKFNFDHVLRITGDNPFIDSDIINQLVAKHVQDENVISFTKGLPMGMNFAIMNGKQLGTVSPEKLDEQEQEHVTLYFKRPEFKSQEVTFDYGHTIGQLRLTVDYPEDFAMASILLSELKENSSNSLISRIIELNRTSSWIFAINSSKDQKNVFPSAQEELNYAITLLDNLDLKKSSTVLKSWLNDHKSNE